MLAIIGKILLRISLFLLPAVRDWIEQSLKAPPPPDVPKELHDEIQTLLPVKSASQEAADKLKGQQ